MNYTKDEFFALVDAVEKQGGELTDDLCEPADYDFNLTKAQERTLGPLTFPACGNASVFEVPYDALNKEGDEVGVQPVKVCAVDDDMARWPRFGGDAFAK